LEEKQVYEFLKKLLSAAEQIGTVETVRQTVKSPDSIWGDEVTITGTTIDGRSFSLSLELKGKESKNAS
jgi:hypothetical protein